MIFNEVKVNYTRQTGEDNPGKVREAYLVESISCSDAEKQGWCLGGSTTPKHQPRGEKRKAMKTYVITISQRFPATHPRKGEPTYFKEKIHNALLWEKGENVGYALNPSYAIPQDQPQMKPHTLRGNYELWRGRFDEVERGEAEISLRQWSGKPYASKQIEIARLTKDDGIGIQKIQFPYEKLNMPSVEGNYTFAKKIARNDGLLYEDWEAWFKSYDLSKPLAIIHFTSFRYGKE